jgi:pimeloyl-ACP methyl ester carboxylesterase
VFVCSTPPEPGRSLNDVTEGERGLTDERALSFKESIDPEGRYVWRDFETAAYAMYHDCVRSEALSAFRRLRPQATTPFVEPWPLKQWPDLPTTFIVCSEDRMGRAQHLRRIARRRFGVEALQLPGGHSPFVSRPGSLVETLLEAVS